MSSNVAGIFISIAPPYNCTALLACGGCGVSECPPAVRDMGPQKGTRQPHLCLAAAKSSSTDY
jgi:hypothetical protein